MKAVVVDLRGKQAAALDETGSVLRIPNANYHIGQEIELHEIRQTRSPSLKKAGIVAAAAALVFGIGTGTAYAVPYGTVNLDTDSAIAYTINRFDRVLKVEALNEEGEKVLSSLDQRSLRFQPVEQAIAATLEQQEPDGEISVQITAETKNEQHTEKLQKRLMDSMPEKPRHGHPDAGAEDSEEFLPADDHPDIRDHSLEPRSDPFPESPANERPEPAVLPSANAETPPHGETAEAFPEISPDRPNQPPSGDDMTASGIPPAELPDSAPEAPTEPREFREPPESHGGMAAPEQHAFDSFEFGSPPPAE